MGFSSFSAYLRQDPAWPSSSKLPPNLPRQGPWISLASLLGMALDGIHGGFSGHICGVGRLCILEVSDATNQYEHKDCKYIVGSRKWNVANQYTSSYQLCDGSQVFQNTHWQTVRIRIQPKQQAPMAEATTESIHQGIFAGALLILFVGSCWVNGFQRYMVTASELAARFSLLESTGLFSWVLVFLFLLVAAKHCRLRWRPGRKLSKYPLIWWGQNKRSPKGVCLNGFRYSEVSRQNKNSVFLL